MSDPIAWLRTPGAIRERSGHVLAAGDRGALRHFAIDRARLDAAADYVIATMRANYPTGEIPLPRDLNAASFAKLDSRAPSDVAHALMGMLGENIALICGTLARSVGAQAVVYCGSTLLHNPELREILRWVTAAYGAQPHFLDEGAYCGALGAAHL